MEYISKAEALRLMWESDMSESDYKRISNRTNELPTIEIIHCSECRHTDEKGYCEIIKDNPPLAFFCRMGERKE